MTLTQLFTAIANAIRSKTGSQSTIIAENFPTEISNIQTGITPTGTISITQNGETDVTNYATANVNVPNPQPNLQSKSQTITTNNTTTTITPDSGYDGLSSVEVTTNISSEYNVKINDSLTYNTNYGIRSIIEEVDMIETNLTRMDELFIYCTNLKAIKNWDTSNTTNLSSALRFCSSLETLPEINTQKCADLQYFANGCTSLVNVPVLSFKSPLGSTNKLANMFSGCPSLSNESLNNILYSCANAYTWLSGTKTLKQLGLSSAQATTCQSLSNWNDFVAAGWSTGY